MDLTLDQKDTLTELINIGYGRAAGALSELTGYRISLEVPQVSMHEIRAIAPMLQELIAEDVASVSQLFSGPISGRALLMMDGRAALELSRLLTDDRMAVTELDSSSREIITEVGNILLNACLGVFGNLLNVHVIFAVPQMMVQSVRAVFEEISEQAAGQVHYGLMIHTRFQVRAGDVTGYLVIVLGISSLDRLLAELERWERGQLE